MNFTIKRKIGCHHRAEPFFNLDFVVEYQQPSLFIISKYVQKEKNRSQETSQKTRQENQDPALLIRGVTKFEFCR